MARPLFRLALACLLVMTLVLPAGAASRVWVALAEDGGAYAEAAAVLKTELDGAELTVGTWQGLLSEKNAPPDLILTVGVAAFEGILGGSVGKGGNWATVPVLATLLPRAAFDSLVAGRHAVGTPGRRVLSAAVLDQPIGRQMALLKRALPDRRHVGVLAGPQTQALLPMLQKEAGARGLALVAVPVAKPPEDLYPALKAVLEEADVILALPEPTVYHGASLQNILLTTYRARVPMLAFSAAYAKAGAVLALYSTPSQVARRAAEMTRTWMSNRGLPTPQGPREFTVATNAKVAASLGLQLDDAATLAEDLRRMEGAH